jgi:hypothetical protein
MPLITTEKKYEYEVAFSFHQQDESLAFQIRDSIQERLSNFIYSEQQKKLIANNGVDKFSKVFRDESRIVVVLYREEWGTTYWTKVEETAIKERVQEESADFTVFISLDAKKPQWLSKTQLWYDFERFGLESTAAIIERKVNEYGGQVREESVEDLANRHLREEERKIKVKDYLDSIEATKDAQKEIVILLDYVKSNIEKIHSPEKNFSFGREEYKSSFGCYNSGINLYFSWMEKYYGEPSYLNIILSKSSKSIAKQPTIITEKQYSFSLNEADSKGWVDNSNKKEFKTSEQLIDMWLKDFLNKIRNERIKE